MNREQITGLYDDVYASDYEARFLHSPLAQPDSTFELELLGRYLRPGVTWLDVACGTGYCLSHFPETYRAGLDLSPAMLERARRANPGVEFRQHDMRVSVPDWEGKWDFVSCMWYAYGLVDSMNELIAVLGNLASWTSPEGRCFVPLANPRLIAGVDLPYQAASAWSGKVMVTGITWSYLEDDGSKVHAHQLAPCTEFMIEQFQRHFEEVDLVDYPPAFPGWARRSALMASQKKLRSCAAALPGAGLMGASKGAGKDLL